MKLTSIVLSVAAAFAVYDAPRSYAFDPPSLVDHPVCV